MTTGRHDSDLSTLPPPASRAYGRGVAGWALGRPAGFRRWTLGLYWVAIFLLTHWPEVDDFPRPRWLFADFDLVVHGCLYAGWATVWCWVLDGQGYAVRGRVIGWLMAGGASYAIFDELTQAIVGRDPAVSDIIADMLGIGLALLFIRWGSRRPGAGTRVGKLTT